MANSSHVRQILDMLKEGKITVDEADRLIRELSARGGPSESAETLTKPNTEKRKPPKYLRVSVNDNEDSVDVRVPIRLLKFGLDISEMLPEEHRQKVKDRGVDLGSLSSFSSEELAEALEGLSVDVNEGDDAKVKVFTE